MSEQPEPQPAPQPEPLAVAEPAPQSDPQSGLALPANPTGFPPPPVRSRRTLPIVTALVGLVVGAAGVGLPWLLSGNAGAFGNSLTAPESFPGYQKFTAVATQSGRVSEMVQSDVLSGQLLSTAYAGAPAVVQHYTNQGLDQEFVLNAVAASSPRPYVQYEDAKYLQLAAPPDQVLTIGDVDCVLYNQPTPAGQQPDPSSVGVRYCQRTGSGLTVQIQPAGGDLTHNPRQVAVLTDQAWSALS